MAPPTVSVLQVRNLSHKTPTRITDSKQQQHVGNNPLFSHCSQLHKQRTNWNTATWHIITSVLLENKLYPPLQNLQTESTAYICTKKRGRKKGKKAVFPLELVLCGKVFSLQHLAPISSGNFGHTVLCWNPAMLKWPNSTHFLRLKPSALNILFLENVCGMRAILNTEENASSLN